jgi:hypothetical protein
MVYPISDILHGVCCWIGSSHCTPALPEEHPLVASFVAFEFSMID